MPTSPDNSPKVTNWKHGNHAVHFLVSDQGNTYIVARMCDGRYLHYDQFGIAVEVEDRRTFLREIAVGSFMAANLELIHETP